MALPRKDSARLRSRALTSSARARQPATARKLRRNSSVQDLESFAFSFWLGVDCLLQSRSCQPCVVGRFKQLLNNLLESRDLLGYLETCSAVRSELVQTGRWNATSLRSLRFRWGKALVNAVEAAIPRDQIVHPSPTFDAVVTFLGWLKRLPVMIRDSEEAVDDYYENDRRLSSINFEDNVYVPQLREIWIEWLKKFELRDPFLPRHGSGSTADAGRTRSQKWDKLGWDSAARVCLHYPDLRKVLDFPPSAMTRTAKVVFVPKQAGKDRTICMEPAWLQFLQQGVAGQLVSYIHRHRKMKMYINLYSQDVNRELCVSALPRRLATIDLSDASDCVSWRLIRILTHRLPLARYLYATRSVSTIIDGRTVRFDKYAPMGSALCFPVECILFASIVELAYRIHNGEASQGHLSGCSVYGDDIICPAEIYHLVVDILQTLGFKVNTSKSFSSGIYYESCGVEVCNGAVIHTVKHPRAHILPKDVVSPEQIGLVTDLANSLLYAGYLTARRSLLKSFEKSRIVVGNRSYPFMDFLIFNDKNLVPVAEPYYRKVWRSDLQVSGIWKRSVETVSKKHIRDWDEYQSRMLLRTDSTSDGIHPKWTPEGITSLTLLGHHDLLRDGDVEVVGACRTGRMHYKVRKRFLTL